MKKTRKESSPSTHLTCARQELRQSGEVRDDGDERDFIFADPPYALKELPAIPGLIFEMNLLKADGIFVFEHGKDYDFSQHPHFVEHRQYGSVNFSLFRA